MNEAKLENYVEERLLSLKSLKSELESINPIHSDLFKLKELLRLIFVEKTKESSRIIKEDNFIDTFFLMRSLTHENLKFFLLFLIKRNKLQIKSDIFKQSVIK